MYIWSASNSADLKWVKVGEENGRDRLNERPIILKSNAGPLALAMTMVHLLQDYDQIKIQRFPMLDEPKKPLSQRTAVQIMSSKLRSSLKTILWTASIATCTNLFLYAWFFRRFAWAWSLWIGRLIWDIPRSAKSPSVLPYHYTLLLRAWTSSFFLICLWELSNVAFSAWVCQPPVKYNRPLTTDSRDPNASLISGLRSRKSLTKVRIWYMG